MNEEHKTDGSECWCNPEVQTQNKKGKWVTAIPEPYYSVIQVQCGCGETFFTLRGYKGHYALEHILEL